MTNGNPESIELQRELRTLSGLVTELALMQREIVLVLARRPWVPIGNPAAIGAENDIKRLSEEGRALTQAALEQLRRLEDRIEAVHGA
jgi:hypothetical protein